MKSRHIFTIFSLIVLCFLMIEVIGQVKVKSDPGTAVSLVYKDTITVPSFTTFDLPVKILGTYNISAISLGFYFPDEYLEIDTMSLIDGRLGYYYNITDSLFRVSWSDITPISAESNDTLLVLKINTLDISALSNTIRLGLYNLSEFADENANVIENVVLEIPEIEYLKPDPGDSIYGNYVAVYPNPFKDYTVVNFSLKMESQVKMTLYNTAGISIFFLDEKTFPEGPNEIRIDGLDLAKGVYFLKFELSNPEMSGSLMFKLVNCR